MAAIVKAKKENIDYSEAAYVDSQYEYLQKHKSEGINIRGITAQACGQRLNQALFYNAERILFS